MSKPHPNYAPTYAAAMYPELATICRRHGYALAVHGSLARDLDVIAIPWTEDSGEPQDVLDDILTTFAMNQLGGFTGKPHGRTAVTLSVGWGNCAIDLQFMPKRKERQVPLVTWSDEPPKEQGDYRVLWPTGQVECVHVDMHGKLWGFGCSDSIDITSPPYRGTRFGPRIPTPEDAIRQARVRIDGEDWEELELKAEQEIQRLRLVLEEIQHRHQTTLDLYEKNGPTWTSRETGAEYYDAGYVTDTASEIVELINGTMKGRA